ncbi:MAG: hypothetical protein U0T78_06825 [Cloacibacterium normanense]
MYRVNKNNFLMFPLEAIKNPQFVMLKIFWQ